MKRVFYIIRRHKIIFLLIALACAGVSAGVFVSQQRWGLTGAYYTNTTWEGEPAVIQIGQTPYLEDEAGYNLLSTNRFSVRWGGWIAIPKSGTYTFATNSDDGSHLRINGQEIVNNGGAHGLQKVTSEVSLEQGVYPIEVLYLQIGGYSALLTSWTPPEGSEKLLPPEILFSEQPGRFGYIARKGTVLLARILPVVWGGAAIVAGLLLLIKGMRVVYARLRTWQLQRRVRKQFQAKNLLINLLVLSITTLIMVMVAEVFLRWYAPYSTFGAGTELPWMRNSDQDLSKAVVVDPDFGFRPVLGDQIYTEYGTLARDRYAIEKAPGVTRLLFIGDSVTARGKIVEALKELYGEERFEYWNAGVESFNTLQEVKFYRRYNAAIEPDHVILSFSLNDFETTPVAFVNSDNKIVVYVPHKPQTGLSPWFFQHSYLYRLILGLTLNDRRRQEEIADEIRSGLRELHALLNEQQIKFTVLVLPAFRLYDDWLAGEKEARQHILRILEEERIRYVDLFPPFQQAVEHGVAIQEQAGDPWHPSGEIADMFARYLFEQQLL